MIDLVIFTNCHVLVKGTIMFEVLLEMRLKIITVYIIRTAKYLCVMLKNLMVLVGIS